MAVLLQLLFEAFPLAAPVLLFGGKALEEGFELCLFLLEFVPALVQPCLLSLQFLPGLFGRLLFMACCKPLLLQAVEFLRCLLQLCPQLLFFPKGGGELLFQCCQLLLSCAEFFLHTMPALGELLGFAVGVFPACAQLFPTAGKFVQLLLQLLKLSLEAVATGLRRAHCLTQWLRVPDAQAVLQLLLQSLQLLHLFLGLSQKAFQLFQFVAASKPRGMRSPITPAQKAAPMQEDAFRRHESIGNTVLQQGLARL